MHWDDANNKTSLQTGQATDFLIGIDYDMLLIDFIHPDFEIKCYFRPVPLAHFPCVLQGQILMVL